MYSMIYHFQIDDQNERINQTIKIVFRFYFVIMKNFVDWSNTLSKIQRHFNNEQFAIIDKTFNEIIYDFTFVQSFNLKKFVDSSSNNVDVKKIFVKIFFSLFARVKIEIVNSIVFVQMNIKHHYDRKHQSFYMKFDDHVFIQLHRDYDISSIVVFNFKFNQQYVDFFKILKKIDQLLYRLNLFSHWRIHSMLLIIQLKSTSFDSNLYRKSRFI